MKKLNEKELLYKFNEIHNDKYDYSLVKYINMRTKIKIICPIHDVFEQLPSSHLNGEGCNKCGILLKAKNLSLSLDIFIKNSNKIHDNKFDYSLVEYVNNHTKVKIICKIHGVFEQKPISHLNKQGCCKCNRSKNENYISLFLKNININYFEEYKFDDCKYKRKLPFDFYLPDFNLCIEYDGEQHYKITKYWGGNDTFKKIQIRDKIKTEYCKQNNIGLLRIKYNENIEEILNNFFKY
jgi:very-short-patch-repair endonuclease